MAAMYAVYHGPDGLRGIATDVARKAEALAERLRSYGLTVSHDAFFDTIRVVDARSVRARDRARAVARLSAVLGERCHGRRLGRRDHDRRRPRRGRVGVRPPVGGRARRPRGAVRGCRTPGRRRGLASARRRVPHASRLQHASQRDGDDALPQAARRPRLRAGSRHDPARLVHDEAQRRDRDGRGLVARVLARAPVRPRGGRARIPRDDRAARDVAGRGHRLRRGLAPAERRFAGRAGRAPRDPRLASRERRSGPHGLSHPVVRARHECGIRCPGRNEGRRRRVRRGRQRRPRRPARQDRRRTPIRSRR